MTLRDMQLSFIQCAQGLGDYQAMSKLELANGYCKADEEGDEQKRSQYWAALLLRYWYKIYEWIKNSASCQLQQEDFFSWLHDSLYDAFYYRSWWWEYEAVVRQGKFIEWKLDENGNKIPNEHYYKVDPSAADKSINYFCSARRGKEYQALNKQKRKSNVLRYSLDAAQEENGDYILEQCGAVEQSKHHDGVKELVSNFVKRGRLIEALIVDGIAYQDSFKETEKSHYETTVEEVLDESTGEVQIDEETGQPLTIEIKEKVTDYDSVFDERRLVRHLNCVDDDFMERYFNQRYEIPEEVSKEILEKLKKLNNARLYNYIRKTIINLQKSPELLNYLRD